MDHGELQPASRTRSPLVEAHFFPGEVARLLALGEVDYSQLRRLFVLSRTTRGEVRPSARWARFTLTDLASTEVLVGLGGGRSRLQAGRRLILGDIENACAALREMGITNPLLDVPLARNGRRILAVVGRYVMEPSTGQFALGYAQDQIDSFLQERLIEDHAVRAAIRAERLRVQPMSTRQIDVTSQSVPFQPSADLTAQDGA